MCLALEVWQNIKNVKQLASSVSQVNWHSVKWVCVNGSFFHSAFVGFAKLIPSGRGCEERGRKVWHMREDLQEAHVGHLNGTYFSRTLDCFICFSPLYQIHLFYYRRK